MNINENLELRKVSRLNSYDKIVLRAYADRTFEIYTMPAERILRDFEKNVTYKAPEVMVKRG